MRYLLAAAFLAFSLVAQAADLPDPTITPGAILTTDAAIVCVPGYAGSVRHVTKATKRAAYKRYGLPYNDRSRCAEGAEVDHLVSLQLGGSNDISNLWPQAYCGKWNAHKKDLLEGRLHYLVCKGKIPLAEAQEAIAKDWIKAYRKYMPRGGKP
jgi:hypothetical protein